MTTGELLGKRDMMIKMLESAAKDEEDALYKNYKNMKCSADGYVDGVYEDYFRKNKEIGEQQVMALNNLLRYLNSMHVLFPDDVSKDIENVRSHKLVIVQGLDRQFRIEHDSHDDDSHDDSHDEDDDSHDEDDDD